MYVAFIIHTHTHTHTHLASVAIWKNKENQPPEHEFGKNPIYFLAKLQCRTLLCHRLGKREDPFSELVLCIVMKFHLSSCSLLGR